MDILKHIEHDNPLPIHYKLRNLLSNTHNALSHTYTSGRSLKDTLYCTLEHQLYNWTSNSGGPLNIYHTLIALCAQQLKKDIKIYAQYLGRQDVNENTTLEDYKRQLPEPSPEYVTINIIHAPVSITHQKEIFNEIPAENRISQIENYLIQDTSHFVRVYKNFKGNSYAIITNNINPYYIGVLITLLPHLLNISVIPENADVSEDVRLCNALFFKIFTAIFNVYFNNASENKAWLILKEAFAQLNDNVKLDPNVIKNFFKNVTTTYNTRQKANIKSKIYNKEQTIQSYEQSLIQLHSELLELNRQYNAIMSLQDLDFSVLIEALQNNKNIELLQITPSTISFRVTAPLQYFVSSDFEAYERNKSNTYNQIFNNDEKVLLHKIFIDHQYSILLQSVINFRLNTSSTELFEISASQNFSDHTEFPNPHLLHYNCWSQARTEIYKNIQQNNLELIVPQIIAAVQSVNVAENASFYNRMLCEDLKNTAYVQKLHIVNNTTKSILTWQEALDEINNAVVEPDKKKNYTQTVIEEEEIDENESYAEDDNNETD